MNLFGCAAYRCVLCPEERYREGQQRPTGKSEGKQQQFSNVNFNDNRSTDTKRKEHYRPNMSQSAPDMVNIASLLCDSLKIEKKVAEPSQKCVPMCHVLTADLIVLRVEQVDTAVNA